MQKSKQKEEGIFQVRKKMGLRIFLQNWNDFANRTEFGIVLEYFCGIEVGLRISLSEEKREEEFDLGNFCPKSKREKRSWT